MGIPLDCALIMNMKAVFVIVLVGLMIVDSARGAGECVGNRGTRSPLTGDGCPVYPCRDVGCDSEVTGAAGCRYANKVCNQCSVFRGAEADFMFAVDISGSMRPEIVAVRDGLTRFVNEVGPLGLDAQFGVIVFGSNRGNGHHLLQPLTSDVNAVTTTLSWMADNVGGGWEPGLEAMWKAANGAPNRQYFLGTESGSATMSSGDIDIAWRSGAFKNIIMLADEDADAPFTSDNYPSGVSSMNTNAACVNNEFSSSAGFAAHVNDVAATLIAGDFRMYALVNPGATCTQRQFGVNAHAVEWDDFTHFSAELTMQEYRAANQPGILESLQYKMLEAGKISRVYNVLDIGIDAFVDNFFKSMLDQTELCDVCTSAVCVNDVCVSSPLCDDGDLCTTDSCSNSTGTAVCSFVSKDCSNEPLDVCTDTQCDPATGTCSIPLPKTCTGVAPTPCEEYRCNVEQNGDCTLFPRTCDTPEDPECFVARCDPKLSCVEDRVLNPPDRCLVPGECRPECGPNGNCTEGTGTQNSFCVCFDGWSGPQCYVPPCNLTCSQNGTCNTYLNPDCDVDGLLNKDIPGECWESRCDCDPGFGGALCLPPSRSPAPEILSERNIAIASSIAVLAIVAAVVLAVILWRLRKLQTEIAELDAFANAESIGSNPLFKAGNDWQVSAIHDD